MTLELSQRQRDVLLQIAAGKCCKTAGRALGIEYGTVKGHLKMARLKLGARTNTAAVAIAIRAGLI